MLYEVITSTAATLGSESDDTVFICPILAQRGLSFSRGYGILLMYKEWDEINNGPEYIHTNQSSHRRSGSHVYCYAPSSPAAHHGISYNFV